MRVTGVGPEKLYMVHTGMGHFRLQSTPESDWLTITSTIKETGRSERDDHQRGK